MQSRILRWGLLDRFAECRRGVAAIEFALALPALLLLVAGVIEVAMVLFAITLAEGGLREGSRYGLTGQTPDEGTREQQILQIVEDHTHGLVDTSESNLVIVTYPGFDDVDPGEPFTDVDANGSYDVGEPYEDLNSNGERDSGNGSVGAGAAGAVVVYTLEFDWEFLTPVFEIFGGPEGKLALSASIAVRNEPF